MKLYNIVVLQLQCKLESQIKYCDESQSFDELHLAPYDNFLALKQEYELTLTRLFKKKNVKSNVQQIPMVEFHEADVFEHIQTEFEQFKPRVLSHISFELHALPNVSFLTLI